MVAILKVDVIGDYVLMRNYFHELKKSKKYREKKLFLIGSSSFEVLAREFDSSIFDEFYFLDRDRFYHHFFYRFKVLWKLSKLSFETVISPTYARILFLEESLAFCLTAKNKIGHVPDELNLRKSTWKLCSKFYHQIIQTDEDIMFEFLRNKQFFEELLQENIDLKRPKLEVKEKGKSLKLENYVVFVPGANQESRRWPIKHFVEVGRRILENTDYKIYLVGTEKERDLGKDIEWSLNNPFRVSNRMGKQNLIELVDTLRYSAFIISNETGTVHLGVALSKKVYCPSNGQHFLRFHPYPKLTRGNPVYRYPKPLMERIKKEDHWQVAKDFIKGSDLDLTDVRPESFDFSFWEKEESN